MINKTLTFFAACLFVSTVSIADEVSKSDASAEAPIEEVTPSSACEPRFCTFQYAPATCTFAGQTFSGSNACVAIESARGYACYVGISFDTSALSCTDDLLP